MNFPHLLRAGIGVVGFVFLLAGCRKPIVDTPPATSAAEPQPMPSLSSSAFDVKDIGKAGVAMRLEVAYRLEPSFAQAFPGGEEDVVATVRERVFRDGDPGDAVKLRLHAAKTVLAANFSGVGTLQNQARLAGWLGEGGWWKMPSAAEASVAVKRDPEAERVREKALSYQHALLQLGNAAARQAALDEMAAALSGNDPVAKLAALDAMSSASQVEFDRSKFRTLILPLLNDPSGKLRAAALGGLLAANPPTEDLSRILQMVDDPAIEVRRALPFSIKQLARGDLTGEASGAIIKLLDKVDPLDLRSFLSSLWGSRYSQELEEKLVGMTAPFDRKGYDVVYYSLSTQQNKGEKTVDVLLDCLSKQEFGVGNRALWGLGYGVNPEQRPRVADAALEFLTARTTDRDECLKLLSSYGTERHAERLTALLTKGGLTPPLQKEMESTVAAIRTRQSGN